MDSIWLVTYWNRNSEKAEEEIIEISAHSEAQAVFLAPCSPDDIIKIEKTIGFNYCNKN